MKIWKCLLCAMCMVVALCCGSVASAAEGPSDEQTISADQQSVSAEEMADDSAATAQDDSATNVGSLPVKVVPPNDEGMDLMMLYGTRVVISEGTRYYASADGGGSGTWGTIGNIYTPLGTDLYVGGFARLDEIEQLEEYLAYNPKYVPVAEHWLSESGKIDWDEIWVGIFLNPEDDRPIGWVPARSIVVLNGVLGDGKTNAAYRGGIVVVSDGENADADQDVENVSIDLSPEVIEEVLQNPEKIAPEVVDNVLQDPGNMIEDRIIKGQDDEDDADDSSFISTREIAYAIEDYADRGEKVALLLDASGSVSMYMDDIANYGEYVDKVNKADIIIVFAEWFEKIAAEDYLSTDVGSSTDIYSPLNSLENVASYDRIILVTDTEHNHITSALESVAGFKGKIVVVCPIDLDDVQKWTIKDIETAFETTVYLCRLDNELDRIRTLEVLSQTE